jgi:hypothetical protein
MPPFLEDRLYADFNRAYYPALAHLTAFIHAVDTRLVSNELSRIRLHSVEDVRALLARIGWDSLKYVDAKDYETVRRILKRSGVNLPTDEFVLVAAPKSKRDRPRPFKVRK